MHRLYILWLINITPMLLYCINLHCHFFYFNTGSFPNIHKIRRCSLYKLGWKTQYDGEFSGESKCLWASTFWTSGNSFPLRASNYPQAIIVYLVRSCSQSAKFFIFLLHCIRGPNFQEILLLLLNFWQHTA